MIVRNALPGFRITAFSARFRKENGSDRTGTIDRTARSGFGKQGNIPGCLRGTDIDELLAVPDRKFDRETELSGKMVEKRLKLFIGFRIKPLFSSQPAEMPCKVIAVSTERFQPLFFNKRRDDAVTGRLRDPKRLLKLRPRHRTRMRTDILQYVHCLFQYRNPVRVCHYLFPFPVYSSSAAAAASGLRSLLRSVICP